MPGQHRPELSVTQLIAGAGATVTATVAASYFGVGGTLIGAGAVSVLSTIGATFYQHFLDRGKAGIAARIPARVGGGAAGSGSGSGSARPAAGPATGGRPWPKWYVLLGAATGVFLAVMGLVTAFELFTGKPLSNTMRGGAGHGTSVHPVPRPVRPAPAPPASHQATPDASATSSAEPTPGTTPRATPTPSSSETPRMAPEQRSPEATAGPPVIHSPAPQPSDGDGWHTPG